MIDIILASSSPYRRQLLERLQLPFRCVPPEADETPLPGEHPGALAGRLALDKARVVAAVEPRALVIGSDQVASLDGLVLGKPGSHAAARQQLRASSGRVLHFWTGLAVVCRARGLELRHTEPFSVHFRDLADAAIDAYLTREQPFDCAGSFKWEGLGIALFEKLAGNDPTSLEGLPLIALTGLLGQAGIDILAP
ncbi:MAG: Maf family nucleotide pyrophosphatase [Halioglobus sp.]